MGPIYGTALIEMADVAAQSKQISLADTLHPAAASLKELLRSEEEFDIALSKIQESARKGGS